jgi:hypothetical protein
VRCCWRSCGPCPVRGGRRCARRGPACTRRRRGPAAAPSAPAPGPRAPASETPLAARGPGAQCSCRDRPARCATAAETEIGPRRGIPARPAATPTRSGAGTGTRSQVRPSRTALRRSGPANSRPTNRWPFASGRSPERACTPVQPGAAPPAAPDPAPLPAAPPHTPGTRAGGSPPPPTRTAAADGMQGFPGVRSAMREVRRRAQTYAGTCQ